MTLEMLILGAIVLAAIFLFALDIFPVDKVSLMVLSGLVLTGLITGEEAVSGFGNTATITVACMLALSYGIERTGALNFAANRIVEAAGGSELRILLAIILSVGFLSAFINNTAAVAIFMPLILTVSRRRGLDASRFLMPMSFAAIFAGTCTLVGTSTNLLIASLVKDQMDWEIQIFEFAPLGMVFFGTGLLYLVFVGRHLLVSRRTTESLTEDYQLQDFVTELFVRSNSRLLGKHVSETSLGREHQIDVIEIIRRRNRLLPSDEEGVLREGDLLLVQGDPKRMMEVSDEIGVELRALTVDDRTLEDENIVLVEAVVSPKSRLVDRTLKEVDFRRQYGANALAIRSHGRTIREKIGKIRLEFGDSLLILTERERLSDLRKTQDFLVLGEVRGDLLRVDKIPYAVAIFLAIIAAATLQIFTILEAALLGTTLMLITGCFQFREVYNNLHWQTIIMLGCLIPLGTAMEKTGMAQLIAQQLITNLVDFGPTAVLSGLYLVTTVLTSIMTNSATGVLMLPIALTIAGALNVDPKPFVFAVMFASSASFMTPMGYQTNTFVFGAGGYRFSDFLRVGGPLNLIFWILATLLIPVFWPF
jgi:di/tricarboxylate transporter